MHRRANHNGARVRSQRIPLRGSVDVERPSGARSIELHAEWSVFKSVIDTVHRNYLRFTPCFLNEDHATLEKIKCCLECNPYPTTGVV